MTRLRCALALVLAALVCSTHALLADVRTDQKTRMEFGGMLGRIVNVFGGKSAFDASTSLC